LGFPRAWISTTSKPRSIHVLNWWVCTPQSIHYILGKALVQNPPKQMLNAEFHFLGTHLLIFQNMEISTLQCLLSEMNTLCMDRQ
jgi:hypothetical protein